MFRGIAALFTSGIIFRPSVLGGIILGLLLSFAVDETRALFLIGNINLYLILAILVAVGVLFFRRDYLENSNKLDWKSMFKTFLSNYFYVVFSMILSLIFWNIWFKFLFS